MAKMDIQKVQKFWENRAKVKNTNKTYFVCETEAKKRNDMELKTIDENIDLTGKNVLDIGCATGDKTIHFAKKAKFVLGIDYTKSLLDIAKEKTNNIKNIDFLHADCTNFDYNKIFDIAIISALFIYLNDDSIAKTIKNIRRHLKNKGIVIVKESIGVRERYEVIDKYSEDLKTIYNAIYRTPQDIITLFYDGGFEIMRHNKLYQHRNETAVYLFIFKMEEYDNEKNEK